MRSKSFIFVAAFVVVLLVAAGAVYAYDSSRENTIADGVTIGGVDVGGMSRTEAGARLESELREPVRQDVVATWRKKRYTLTVRSSEVDVDIARSVDDALTRSRDGNLFTRVSRGLTGGEVDAALEPAVDYDAAAVDKVVRRAARGLQRDAVDAKVSFVDDAVERVRSHAGVKVRTGTLRRQLTAALTSPTSEREVAIKVMRIAPEVTTKQLAKRNPTIIAVDRAAFTLTLYKGLKVAKRYHVAVGQIGLETPAGRYTIQNKAENPTWSVPNSAWAGSLAGTVVPPGPSNPLKARWMGIYGGAGIHGTDSVSSLGSAASHGCVRMAVPDVIDLYDRVDVGTPVYIA